VRPRAGQVCRAAAALWLYRRTGRGILMLLQRILTAIVAAVLILLVLFAFPPAAAKAVIAAIILAAAWEWAKFLSLVTAAERLLYVATIAVLLAAVTWLTPSPEAAEFILKVGLAWW